MMTEGGQIDRSNYFLNRIGGFADLDRSQSGACSVAVISMRFSLFTDIFFEKTDKSKELNNLGL